MIPRYARPEAAKIWDPQTRFKIMFEIEAHAADKMAELGVIPKLAADTIWLNGKTPLHGPDAVMGVWSKYFEAPKAPFSWAPDLVVVLPSGDLAQSSGPVTNLEGRVFARFQSVWRRLPAGGWEIVFDQGAEVCR